ncbi:putative batD protein [Plesiocystis pacifica SIR-1]|uniref:Putative batD protein n=1 Tax=Plesiocystis pacifica SIR-1 TaxID=391625 RepID=A6G2R4_9BACT|nr:BatD family protein [Plesiocystis pacifica]EDM79764.1 putative batD protein [Plesiocystis pacifica SIR-1]
MSSRRDFVHKGLGGAAALMLVGASRTARAAGTQIVASFDTAKIEQGDLAYLEVRVTSDGRDVSRPRFVAVDGLSVEARGTSTSISSTFGPGGGQRTASRTYTYAVTALTPGTYALDIDVEVDGEILHPIAKPKLEVVGIAAIEPEQGKASDVPEDPEQEVIVWPVVDRAEAYVGEQIIYQLQIWERVNGNLSMAGAPSFKDFWSNDLDTPKKARPRRQLIANVPYRVHLTTRRALFPQKAGTATIGGPKLQLQPTVGLFFGSRKQQRPRVYTGRSLAITVKPLPAEGQPPNFPANNVGQFTLSAAVDRTQIAQGEAVRVTVTVAGAGNIPLVELPAWPTIEGVRTYDPKPESPVLDTAGPRLAGKRDYTMLVIAERAGELRIPAIELPYFDPEAGAYRTATSEVLTLTVAENPDAVAPEPGPAEAKQGGDEPRGDAGSQLGGRDEEILAGPVASDTLEHTGELRERWLDHRRWRRAMLAAPSVLGLTWLGVRAAQRLGPDEAGRARRATQAKRRAGLAELSAAVDSGEGFYASLGALLQAVALDRAGPEGVGLTRGRLVSLLREQGVEDAAVDQLRDLLDTCDAARFGAGAGSVEDRKQQLERARSIVDDARWRPK